MVHGQVKIENEVWSAKVESDDIIPVNAEIEVTKIDGVKVIVETKQKIECLKI